LLPYDNFFVNNATQLCAMFMRNTAVRIVFCFFITFAGSQISCMAQSDSLNKSGRKGFIFGMSVGISYLNLDYQTNSTQKQWSATLPNFKIGAVLNKKTTLLLYLPGSIYISKDYGRVRDRGFEGIVPSIQYWACDKVWLIAGAGLGMDAPAFYDIQSEGERKFYFGKTFLTGVGYEFWQKKKVVFDVQGRIQYGEANMPDGKRKGYSINFLIGMNWK